MIKMLKAHFRISKNADLHENSLKHYHILTHNNGNYISKSMLQMLQISILNNAALLNFLLIKKK